MSPDDSDVQLPVRTSCCPCGHPAGATHSGATRRSSPGRPPTIRRTASESADPPPPPENRSTRCWTDTCCCDGCRDRKRYLPCPSPTRRYSMGSTRFHERAARTKSRTYAPADRPVRTNSRSAVAAPLGASSPGRCGVRRRHTSRSAGPDDGEAVRPSTPINR
jgi:hypothetical protein